MSKLMITKALMRGVETGKIVPRVDGRTISLETYRETMHNRGAHSPESIVYSLPS